MRDSYSILAARTLAKRGFDYGNALHHAERVEDTPDPGISNRAISEEEWQRINHFERFGCEPMVGLSDVDYSDIETEFDRYTTAATTYTEKRALKEWDFEGVSVVGYKEKGGNVVANARRKENKIYGYLSGIRAGRKLEGKYGEDKVAPGFSDAIMSICRDVDVYDPRNEIDLFLKYMLVRADFVGGQCHFCKWDDAWIVSVTAVAGFPYIYKCKRCKRLYTPKAGSLFHRTRHDLPVLLDAVRMSLDIHGISSCRMGRELKMTQKSAFTIRRLIRNNSVIADRWPGERDGDPPLKHGEAKPIKLYSLEDLERFRA